MAEAVNNEEMKLKEDKPQHPEGEFLLIIMILLKRLFKKKLSFNTNTNFESFIEFPPPPPPLLPPLKFLI